MKSKLAYLLGGIISAVALFALMIISIIIGVTYEMFNAISIIELIFILIAFVMTICCTIESSLSKNDKTTYMLVIPTVMINLFLIDVTYWSLIQFVLVLIFRVLIVCGAIFYIIGLCSSFQQSKKVDNPEEQQQTTPLNQELQRLLAMKNDGLITEEEFNKLKMNLIKKELQ